MVSIDTLKFDEKGLIPAVVVDEESRDVLTVAYMNRESLELSLREGRTCFWSRSRQALWRKGETSGNVQHIVRIRRLRPRRPDGLRQKGRTGLPSGDRLVLYRRCVSLAIRPRRFRWRT
jgi:hypothetical protein